MNAIFDRQAVEQLGGTLTEDPRASSVSFPTGGTVALVAPVPDTPRLPQAIVRRVMDALALSSAVHAVTTDQNLTATGKAAARATLESNRLAAVAKLDDVRKQVDEMNALAKLAQEALYEPEAIEPTDVVTALADQEIRGFYRTLAGDALTQALDDLQAGENQRHVLALKRSPVSMGELIDRVAEKAWEASLEADKGPKLAANTQDLNASLWALSAVVQIQKILDGLEYHDVAAVQGRQAIRPAPESRVA